MSVCRVGGVESVEGVFTRVENGQNHLSFFRVKTTPFLRLKIRSKIEGKNRVKND